MPDHTFSTSPAYRLTPGVTVTKDSVIFSAVLRDCITCGIILYHKPDLAKTVLPFDDSLRYGSLYSVRISPFDPGEWYYRYYRDEMTFVDPYAREVLMVHSEEDGDISVGECFPFQDDSILPYEKKKVIPWPDRLIYGINIRGFTSSPSCDTDSHGTFLAAAEKIPYLKELGVTAVELMPVYELRQDHLKTAVHRSEPKTMQEALHAWPVSPLGRPIRNEMISHRVNYWGFGEGFYYALKEAFSENGTAQADFAAMCAAFHEAGMEVYLYLYFTEKTSISSQLEIARYYVTHYRVDGFHLSGNIPSVASFASDPILSDTALFYYDFPYDELIRPNGEFPESGIPDLSHLCVFREDYQIMLRRFVKSDDYMMTDFMNRFTGVEKDHGKVNYVCNYDGFTLHDLVTYGERHNWANGEEGTDGRSENFSWNCGVEGETRDPKVNLFRRQQMKNFLTLLFLSQGTPFIYEGDERGHTQRGNNNPYCQNNEITWINWNLTDESSEILDFTRRISRFRQEHAVFRKKVPFRFNDYRAFGFPDISFHGTEAWMPDTGHFSHCLGIMYCENYETDAGPLALVYVAINMFWEEEKLGLPKLPPDHCWKIIMNTSLPKSFDDFGIIRRNEHQVSVPPRSICLLQSVWWPDRETKRSGIGENDPRQLRRAIRKQGPRTVLMRHFIRRLGPGHRKKLLAIRA